MKILKVCLLTFVAVTLFYCNESDDGSYTAPITLHEKVAGSWSLTNLKMIDEYAKTNGIEPSEQNISALFNFDMLEMTFTVNSENQPTTFSVSGNVPPLFLLNGYWQMHPSFQNTNGEATEIYLYSDAQKTQLEDVLLLTSVPGSNGVMEVKLVRASASTPYVSYAFTLTANN